MRDAQECDLLQGFQILADTDTAWGGVAVELWGARLRYIRVPVPPVCPLSTVALYLPTATPLSTHTHTGYPISRSFSQPYHASTHNLQDTASLQ